MKTKRLLSLLLAGAMTTAMLAGCGSKDSNKIGSADGSTDIEVTDSDAAYVKDKGTLIVGITDFAPMDYKEAGSDEWIGFDADMAKAFAESLGVKAEFIEINWDNKVMELDTKAVDAVWNGMTLTGFDADMAKAFAESLGVKAEFIEINWDNKVMELDTKAVDAVWNGMTLTDEVTSTMNCSDPYALNAQVVVVPADKAEQYKDLESIKDLSFAVESGSAGQEVAETLGLNFTAVQTQANALMETSSGASDACVIDLLMAGAMIGEGTSYPTLTYTVNLNEASGGESEHYGVGFRKGSDLTADLLMAGAMIGEGTSYPTLTYTVNLNEASGGESEHYGVGFRKGSDLTAAFNEFYKSAYESSKVEELAAKYGVQDNIVAPQ